MLRVRECKKSKEDLWWGSFSCWVPELVVIPNLGYRSGESAVHLIDRTADLWVAQVSTLNGLGHEPQKIAEVLHSVSRVLDTNPIVQVGDGWRGEIGFTFPLTGVKRRNASLACRQPTMLA
jgi:hypothetical protein